VTAELGRDTVAATQAAERHHQEQLRPLLLLDASLIVNRERERDNGYDYRFTLQGHVRNFGGGAATAVQLVVTPDTQNEQRVPVAIIGPNARLAIKGAQWSAWSGMYRDDNSAWPFRAVLGYSTVGFTLKVGTTTQRSHSGVAADLIVESLTPTDNPQQSA
jgi:hypothetical protein